MLQLFCIPGIAERNHIRKGSDFLAEKYGTVPPKFTKAWWSYFWEYYKWHTIAIAFVILAIVVTAVQCATKEKYDLNITCGGKIYYDTETIDKFKERVSPLAADVDGNGESSVFFQVLTISGERGQEQYDYAMQMKLDLEAQNDCSFIYIFDKERLDRQLNLDYANEVYRPVSEWAPEKCGTDETVKGFDGVEYAVSLENSSLLKELGMNNKDTYAVIMLNNKEDEKNIKAYESSVNILKEIVK